jgi:hypothetical protein
MMVDLFSPLKNSLDVVNNGIFTSLYLVNVKEAVIEKLRKKKSCVFIGKLIS